MVEIQNINPMPDQIEYVLAVFVSSLIFVAAIIKPIKGRSKDKIQFPTLEFSLPTNVSFCKAPHLGQDNADPEIDSPHSLQCINAIIFLFYC